MAASTSTPSPRALRLSPRARKILGIVSMLAVSGTVIAALAVLPARTWMTQRRERIEVESELERLNGDVAQLDAQLGLLRTDAEIERRARENFDLVFPGEESYRILPKAQD